MESNKLSASNFQEKFNRNQKVITIKNLNYLYHNVHYMTTQSSWFKGSRDRGIKI